MGMHMSAAGGGVQYVNRGDPAAEDWNQGALTLDGAWHDLDLSAIVGARVLLVHLRICINDGVAGALFRVRTNGFTNTKNVGSLNVPAAAKPANSDILIVTDSAGKIEYCSDAGMDTIWITIAGWWE